MVNLRELRLRALVTEETARILIDEGIQDFQVAKRKAALRLKLADRSLLPSNSEIEQALMDRQRLFHGAEHAQHLHKLRTVALNAMRMLVQFSPRLTGSVLSGSAGPNSDINLHIFAGSSEEIILKMIDLGIPYQTAEKRLRFRPDTPPEPFPCLRFAADGCDLELVIFTSEETRQPPLSPIDGKPMQRADPARLEKLLVGENGRI